MVKNYTGCRKSLISCMIYMIGWITGFRKTLNFKHRNRYKKMKIGFHILA